MSEREKSHDTYSKFKLGINFAAQYYLTKLLIRHNHIHFAVAIVQNYLGLFMEPIITPNDDYPAITPLDLMPYAVLGAVALLASFEILRALTDDEMVWFKKGSGGDNLGDDAPPRVCRRVDEPITFWFLFVFYLLIIFATAMMFIASLLSKVGFIAWPYN